MNTPKNNINEKQVGYPVFAETIKDEIEVLDDEKLMEISMELIRKNQKAYEELAK